MLINPYKLPTASEERLGGIKAAEKTTETVEVKIDTATGKLYVPASESSGEVNIIEGVKVGGTSLTPASKIVDITFLPTTTTEPTAAWTGGGHKIVILSSEPTTKYAGWIYLIEEVV